MEVLQLSLWRRQVLFFAAHVAIFAWMRYFVAPAKPGKTRILRAAPLLPLLLSLSFLFDIQKSEEFVAAVYAAVNFCWLTFSKIWSFCLNRGQLVKSYESQSDIAFALGLLCNVTVAFDEKPVDPSKDHQTEIHAYRDARFDIIRLKGKALYSETVKILIRQIVKVLLMVVTGKGFFFFEAVGFDYWRDFCMTWYLYGLTSFIQDLTSLLILLSLRLKLAPNFNCPWLSTSLKDAWAHRYNLVFGESLRDLVYSPIVDGSWVHGSTYFKKKMPSPLRTAVGLLATFTVSGLMHSLVMFYAFPIDFPVLYGLFFIVNALVIIAESMMKAVLKEIGQYHSIVARVPSWMFNLYANSVVFTLTHLFFWPEIIRSGFAHLLLNIVMQHV